MKIDIGRKDISYSINLKQITQLCGMNFNIKDYIINSICKYFSMNKYMEYEEEMEENLKINNETVGRKYFEVIRIKSKDDLINLLKPHKAGLLNKYIENKIENIDIQRQLNIIDNALEEIYIKLNKNNFKNTNITYKREDIFSIIQKSSVKSSTEKDLNFLHGKDLLEDVLILLEETQKNMPTKQMIIIENIEHMLSIEEYEYFYEKIKKLTYNFDLWFIIPLCLDNYICLEEEYIEGVNIINNIIFTLPQINIIKTFIENNYPIFKTWTKEEVKTILKPIIHKIGKENIYDLKSNVILKIFNDSLCIYSKHLNTLNTMENNFLLS